MEQNSLSLSSEGDNKVTKITHTTCIKVKEFVYEWKIKNFQYCFKSSKEEFLYSPDFSTDEYLWYIRVYPKNSDSLEKYIDVGLICYTSNYRITNRFKQAHVEFSLVNQEGIDNYTGENNQDIANTTASPKCVAKEIPAERRLIEFNDFEKLFESQKFGDVKVVVGDKEFFVHKSILTARSRVFAAMFEHEMKEQKENKVAISDVDGEVMQEVLRFIYAGKINNIQTLGRDLLMAAEKYDLDGLKIVCEEVLIDDLSVENVNEMLILVDKCCTADKLRASTIDFLTKHRKNVVNSEDFKSVFKLLPPPLLADVISVFMLKL